MSYALRVGQPAATTTRGPVRIPIEGARAVVDGDAVIVFIGYRDPTEDSAPRSRLSRSTSQRSRARPSSRSLFEIGQPDDPGYVTCAAPVNLHEPDAEPESFLDGAGRRAHPLRPVRQRDRRRPRAPRGARPRPRDRDHSRTWSLRLRRFRLRPPRARGFPPRAYGETVPGFLARGERNVCA